MAKPKIQIESRPKRKPTPGAFKKNNPHRFQPGDERINRSGKPANENVLVSRSLRELLGQRAPKAMAEQLGCEWPCSWSQLLALYLVKRSLHPETWAQAFSLIQSLTEPKSGVNFNLPFDEMQESLSPTRLHVHFVSSDGNGGLSPESAALIEAVESGMIEGKPAPSLLGPER